MHGRVVCLEAVLVALFEPLGFEEVRDRVVPSNRFCKTMRIAFSSNDVTRAHAADALAAYRPVVAVPLLWDG